ncbi:hypothetical protein O6H91_19G065600 [Diphasiastrum complanatum]|uniref:Uncharacterized protein n=1 Tax=Diphasiastrum complanatum TaxID=34168 RepID=A0ACC2AW25_DIPCM|nr:hypothetical protein O6H91_19G065600 [Diphasiastrum complanatum]
MLIHNLSATVVGRVAKIDFHVKTGKEAYEMLLGRPWSYMTECLLSTPYGHLIFERGKKHVVVSACSDILDRERASVPDTDWESEDSRDTTTKDLSTKNFLVMMIE